MTLFRVLLPACWPACLALACDTGNTTDGGGQAGAVSAGGSPALNGGAGGIHAGGFVAQGGSSAGAAAQGGTSSSSGGQTALSVCDDPKLVWRTARKTNYTSYPDPGSEECIEFNGCTWAGQFAACSDKQPETWVAAQNIVAAFPDFDSLKLHELCLRKGNEYIVVTVLDTCADSDCSGCCTRNLGTTEQLIDIESYTNARWGVPDGTIEWADLGRAKVPLCE